MKTKERRNVIKAALLVLIIVTVIILSSCTSVEPWEKGTLADYTMRPDRDPLSDTMYEHIYFTREAAAGGRGVGGGGCGCN